MKRNTYLSIFTFFLTYLLASTSIEAQCTTFLEPDGEPGFTNFGRAPIVVGGCPQYKELVFEIFASESYIVRNFVAGNEYAFNICNGDGAGTWVPDFAIVAPSGAVDAFGAGDGDGCTITWTASESGDYQIIINEMGACGTGANTGVDNGQPALTIITDAECDTSICQTWNLPSPFSGYTNFNTNFGGAPADTGNGCETFELGFEVFAGEAYEIDNFVEGVEYAFNICSGAGAGTWSPNFTVISPSGNIDASGTDSDSCTITWTASESGLYIIVINEDGFCGDGDNLSTDNGNPMLTCISTGIDSCVVGMIVSETDVVICGDTSSVSISVEGAVIPEGGGFAYGFRPGDGGTGGNGVGFSITNSSTNTSFDSDINGILSDNSLPPLSGEWEITPFVYTNPSSASESACEISDSAIIAFFNSDLVAEAQDLGAGQAGVSAMGGTAPYTFLWSDAEAQTGATITVSEEGVYTVLVTDNVGCTAMDSVNIMISSVANLPGVEDLSIAPNPTNGQLYVSMKLGIAENANLQVLDLTGRSVAVQQLASAQRSINFDLSEQPNGIYMVRVTVGEASLMRKVVLAK